MRYTFILLYCFLFVPIILAQEIPIQQKFVVKKVRVVGNEKIFTEEQLIPKFSEGNYFEGTLNGLNAIINHLVKAPKEEDFTNVSSIFTPSVFKKIRTFVLENGEPQTFRNLDSDNPWYNFTSLDVFLGPSRKHAFVLKDFRKDDYYEMTIRDNDGSLYQFVYFENSTPEQTFIHQNMRTGRVYWWHPSDKLLSSDVCPLVAQIEDEIVQNTTLNDAMHFTEYQWILKQEFHPTERIYRDIENNDTLSFSGIHFFVNGKNAGTFDINTKERILALKMMAGKQPSFAIFKMNDRYNYRYLFNKEQRKLYLVPLDEMEGTDFLCVEGCTLMFENLNL